MPEKMPRAKLQDAQQLVFIPGLCQRPVYVAWLAHLHHSLRLPLSLGLQNLLSLPLAIFQGTSQFQAAFKYKSIRPCVDKPFVVSTSTPISADGFPFHRMHRLQHT